MGIGQGTLEKLVRLPDPAFWADKSVLVTGHTGFKGSWLSLWLLEMGARVSGIALPPDTDPALFDQLGLARQMDHRLIDIRAAEPLAAAIAEISPDIVLHLAAQPLVLRGYAEPVETWATNVMGTAHVLDAVQRTGRPCTVVAVTTDKVYQNAEWEFGYRETDRLGGHDPYSASKAACELVIDSWRKSFFAGGGRVRLASARAGNVIGGGDWAVNRIVPDIARALLAGEEVAVRAPGAVRPWQHVLDPLGGYLVLAEALHAGDDPQFQDGFNFGPAASAERPVRDLVEACLAVCPGSWRDASRADAPHEAGRLALSIDRARARLGWDPVWDFDRSIAETMRWYRDSAGAAPEAVQALSRRTIADFVASGQRS